MKVRSIQRMPNPVILRRIERTRRTRAAMKLCSAILADVTYPKELSRQKPFPIQKMDSLVFWRRPPSFAPINRMGEAG